MKRVIFTPVAEADVTEAAAWYEARREGLGLEFMGRVQQAVDKIAENPLGYAPVIQDARKANLRQFPYALWFKIEDESIVIACLHHRRDKQVARERVLGITPIPRKRPGPRLG